MVIISNKLGTSLSNLGYRQMAGLFHLNLVSTQQKKDVRKAPLILDPEEIERRKYEVVKRRVYKLGGPMNTFDIDGNDK